MKRTITTVLAVALVASFAASVYYSPYWPLYRTHAVAPGTEARGGTEPGLAQVARPPRR